MTVLKGADANTAVFIASEKYQPVNSSFCHISSLEVYRGREQAMAIEISFKGFNLSDKGIITVRCDL